jgi:hypothetical protein
MSSSKKIISVAALTLAFFVAGESARAQTTHAVALPPGGGDVMYFDGGMGPEPIGPPPEIIGFVGVEGEPGGKTVPGAPFTASFSTQTSQTLSDGNHIQRSTIGTLARDSQGRTRRDMTLSGIGPLAASGKPKQVSMINDPVAGTHYMLDPDKRIAHQMGPHGGNGKGHDHGHTGGAAIGQEADDANVTTTSLGTQTIGGIAAEGTRTTRAIPAGAMGNEKPIVITVERWYSADLQTVVRTTHSDPRMGVTTMQLTEIKRAEPDASLFRVPADYTVQKGGPRGAHHVPPLPPSN